ncbi:MAG TPA: response regulator [Bacteroidia bacterium]|nr:response regulator [Bacteroidia bacterium]
MQALRFVVIEDDQQNAEMIRDFINMNYSKAELSVYATGEEAIRQTRQTPDLFIIDYNLDSVDPNAMDGVQIMMKLKDEHEAPVIFLSSQENATIAANIIKYGADDYVAKNNQDAFNRLEIAINNVLHNIYLQQDIVKQRRFITILAFFLLTLISGLILTRLMS